MELTWMGRYRELVRALVFYSNSSNKGVPERTRDTSYNLTQHEYQVLEYICEFENDLKIMSDISHDLGISQSNITKTTKSLLSRGYVEKFRIGDNKKNLTLKPTDTGREVYTTLYTTRISPVFSDFFSILDNFSQEQLDLLEKAIQSLGAKWGNLNDEKLKKNELTKVDIDEL